MTEPLYTDDPAARTICLDFDGVFNQFQGWTGQYEDYKMLPGIHEFLATLVYGGWRIVISTARPDLEPVKKWLKASGLHTYIAEVTNQKPIAIVYLDDRAVYFDGNFDHALKAIKNLTPHYQKKSGFMVKFMTFLANFINFLAGFSTEEYYEDENV